MMREHGIDPLAGVQPAQDGRPTPGWAAVQRAIAAQSARRN